MLLHIDGVVVEIRPGELFESRSLVESRFLEEISKPEKKVKRKKPITSKQFLEELDASSSSA